MDADNPAVVTNALSAVIFASLGRWNILGRLDCIRSRPIDNVAKTRFNSFINPHAIYQHPFTRPVVITHSPMQ
jgi:hypothetical protein